MIDLEEVVSVELSTEEALERLGAQQIITTATTHGEASVQEVAYPSHEYRLAMKANIQGEQND